MENHQEVEMVHHGNISVAVDGLCFILDRQSPNGNVFSIGSLYVILSHICYYFS